MIAMTMPITTNTTIAICIHIHVGDTAPAYCDGASLLRDPPATRREDSAREVWWG